MKTYLITGASSGIGEQAFNDLYSKEDHFILIGRSVEKLLHLSSGLPNVVFISLDLTEQDSHEKIAKVVQGSPNKKVDCIVFSAGVTGYKPVQFISQHLRDVMEINYFSPVLTLEVLLKKNLVNKDASVIFISSVSTISPIKTLGAYVSSKSAVNGFVKVAALELAGKGIRVNAISPGMVETPLLAGVTSHLSQEAIDEDRKKYPLGYSKPGDISDLICFLLSDKSKKITGSNFIIDGGYSI